MLGYTGVGSIALTAAALLRYGSDVLTAAARGGSPKRDSDPRPHHSRTHGWRAGGTRDEEKMDDDYALAAPEDFEEVWARVAPIEGGLSKDDGVVLYRVACHVLGALPDDPALVEVGRHCGRSTVLLASAMRALRPSDMLVAIDPVEGERPGSERAAEPEPGCAEFRDNLVDAGLLDWVELVRDRSTDVVWGRPIGLLLLDGSHDRADVGADFARFRDSIVPGGLVVLHDHREVRWPEVLRFVDELELDRGGEFVPVTVTGTIAVLQRRP
ncbi:class I SAM-dependent methyltransferase [Saccharothrix sp. NRRL B-16348]|uniref:class I SAM-dependent methyltransferase n=1 Tax=Saccharothrix sp. NRRL B-16348 TaxID=1415542 RepID=UPI001E416032|nr:class I SAM-dependent methyltransferase [Saccharothrix sp. NRRL B-16348]